MIPTSLKVAEAEEEESESEEFPDDQLYAHADASQLCALLLQDIDAAVDVGHVDDPEDTQPSADMLQLDCDKKALFARTLPPPLYNPNKAESIMGDEVFVSKRGLYLLQHFQELTAPLGKSQALLDQTFRSLNDGFRKRESQGRCIYIWYVTLFGYVTFVCPTRLL